LNILQHVELGAFGAECGITFGGFASGKAKLFIQTQRLSSEVGQTTGLMGDRAARIGGCGFPVPGAKALGALGEELGAPTKAGAAPPRRGLPDEGVVLLDLSWSDGSFPWRGDGESSIYPSPEEGRREAAPAHSPRMPG
jgi:hypothetical protein